ncbi:hypothetical protein [Intrasporangium oryzae]|uniref:hypothetical protein n=1 Tax=Intrasporangium oryzae TaxID=412687 RepID=UPI0004AE46CD|nr:hypothetical protein [Intrasporangium oryzae]
MYDPTMLWMAEQRRLSLAAEMRSERSDSTRRAGLASGRWWRQSGPERPVGA